jgi:hypothetical protein
MTQQLQDIANKRVKRMMQDPIGSQSIVAARAQEKIAQGQSGYFSMANVRNREQLVARFRQLQRFLGPDRPGSSLSAFKKEYKKLVETLGGAPDADFYKAYRALLETYPGGSFPGGYDSKEVQRMMMRIDTDGDWHDLLAKTIRFLEGRYEEGEDDEYEEFYEPVDDGEELPF